LAEIQEAEKKWDSVEWVEYVCVEDHTHTRSGQAAPITGALTMDVGRDDSDSDNDRLYEAICAQCNAIAASATDNCKLPAAARQNALQCGVGPVDLALYCCYYYYYYYTRLTASFPGQPE